MAEKAGYVCRSCGGSSQYKGICYACYSKRIPGKPGWGEFSPRADVSRDSWRSAREASAKRAIASQVPKMSMVKEEARPQRVEIIQEPMEPPKMGFWQRVVSWFK
jgi:hypothetical protein